MRLRYSPTSPYVRKVSVAAIELGLDGQIERVPTNPWDPASDLSADNPLGRIPALVLDDGEVLYDSPVIVEYLDALAGGGRLIPAAGPARWAALRRAALADGILDAGVAVLVERVRRPEAYRWPEWIGFQTLAVTRGLAGTAGEVGALAGETPGIAEIGLMCALDWLDFRGIAGGWRDAHPALAAWHDALAARPSFAATLPHDPV